MVAELSVNKLANRVGTRLNQVTPHQPAASIVPTRHRTTTLIVPECDNGAKQKAQEVVTSDVRPCRRKSQTSKNRSGK